MASPGNAGEARLDVIALGRDEVTAVMNKVSGELDQMRTRLAGYERSMRASADASKQMTSSVSSVTASVKESIKPVDQVRSTFENLRANFLGFPTAIAGMVGGFVALIGGLVDMRSATERLDDITKRYEKSIEGVRKQLADLNKELGKPPPDSLEARVADYNDLTAKIMELGSEAARIQRDLDQAAALSIRDYKQIDELEQALARVRTQIKEQDKLRTDYIQASFEATRKQTEELREQERIYRNIIGMLPGAASAAARISAEGNAQRGQAATATWRAQALRIGDAVAGGTARTVEAGRGGGGGGGDSDPWEERLTAFRAAEERDARARANRRITDYDFDALQNTIQSIAGDSGPTAEESRLDMAQALAEQHEHFIAQLEREKEATDQLAERMQNLGVVVGEALPANYARFTESIAGALAAMAKTEDVDKRGIVGAQGMVKAVLDLGAAEAKTARQRLAWKAVEAAGDAAFALGRLDFWGAAQYGAAAGFFGIGAALAGGGGGAGARGGGGGGGASRFGGGGGGGGGNSGPTTIVNNFSSLVTDRQNTTRAIQEAARASASTGYAGRQGV